MIYFFEESALVNAILTITATRISGIELVKITVPIAVIKADCATPIACA